MSFTEIAPIILSIFAIVVDIFGIVIATRENKKNKKNNSPPIYSKSDQNANVIAKNANVNQYVNSETNVTRTTIINNSSTKIYNTNTNSRNNNDSNELICLLLLSLVLIAIIIFLAIKIYEYLTIIQCVMLIIISVSSVIIINNLINNNYSKYMRRYVCVSLIAPIFIAVTYFVIAYNPEITTSGVNFISRLAGKYDINSIISCVFTSENKMSNILSFFANILLHVISCVCILSAHIFILIINKIKKERTKNILCLLIDKCCLMSIMLPFITLALCIITIITT